MHRRPAAHQRGDRAGSRRGIRHGDPGRSRSRSAAPNPFLVVAGSLVLMAAVAGCARGDPVVHISMFDNFYDRDLTRVPRGTRVTFDNEGRIVHNALAVNGDWRTPQRVEAGESVTMTFDRPGSYVFYCSFHATAEGEGMAARLVVGS